MGKANVKSTNIQLLTGGLQEYGDPIAIPKNKKTIATDIHINAEGFLQKRPGRILAGPVFSVEEPAPPEPDPIYFVLGDVPPSE
jgi:hypothetical protein